MVSAEELVAGMYVTLHKYLFFLRKNKITRRFSTPNTLLHRVPPYTHFLLQ